MHFSAKLSEVKYAKLQNSARRMPSSGMLHLVALVRTEDPLEPREPHGVTSQKTTFFIVSAVKVSNLTYH
jgi:hypothetical protein